MSRLNVRTSGGASFFIMNLLLVPRLDLRVFHQVLLCSLLCFSSGFTRRFSCFCQCLGSDLCLPNMSSFLLVISPFLLVVFRLKLHRECSCSRASRVLHVSFTCASRVHVPCVSAALPCGLRVDQIRQLPPSGPLGPGEIH